MLASTDKNFKNESTPDKEKWKPLKPATVARRLKKGKGAKILQDSGALKSSPQFKGESKNKLKIFAIRKSDGTDIAIVHQEGSKDGTIPKRSFMGFSNQDANNIAEVFSLWVGDKLKN
jgi:phage virion morphogenesis protein